jgi:DNA polymerase
MPPELYQALTSPSVIVRAFNAAFERLITQHVLGIEVPIERWQCSQAAALSLGFPASLDPVLKAIGLEPKDARGKKLIQKFSKPAPKNHTADRYDWNSHPEDWQAFCEYCEQDVVAERNLWTWMEGYKANLLWSDYYLDQRINDRGFPFDLALAKGAVQLLKLQKEDLHSRIRLLTQLDKVTRGPLLDWFAQHGVFLPDTRRQTLEDALTRNLPGETQEVMQLWTEYSTRAGDKFAAVLRSESEGRMRGTLQINGASRTGRWAGRFLQTHNLKSTLVPGKEIPNLVGSITGTLLDEVKQRWPDHTVSALIGSAVRHGIRSDTGQTLVVCDWSSIESRVLGWLTFCTGINNTFTADLDTYKVFAAEHFNLPYDKVTKAQRSFAKPPTLGCGYGLGADGLIRYAKGYGLELSLEESESAVNTFRTMYSEVPTFWQWVNSTTMQVIRQGNVVEEYRLKVWRDAEFLYITLPSGRRLCYFHPLIEKRPTSWGEEVDSFTYFGVDQMTGQWVRIGTYGGKLTENIVQAIAADILREGLRAIDPQLPVLLHVHDEIVSQAPVERADAALEFMRAMMSQSPAWAPDLVLKAEGWTGERYAKF